MKVRPSLKLIVLRHAKSNWKADYVHDHDRPLAPRGVRASRSMGVFLARVGSIPDLMLTSSAVRARATVELASEAGKWRACPLHLTRSLYEASASAALSQLRLLKTGPEIVLLSGHEPCCSELVGELIGHAEILMPTATAARIDLSIKSWEEIAPGLGTLRWLVTPKLLQLGAPD
ncbi:MAG: histidine phosphatase family protein [Deltaproteobacteria bacterium]|nr:histidine phosphatase family protein [Deltaproteobacteria bacterium]